MKPTLQGLGSWLHGVPVGCSVLYNMHMKAPPQALEGPGEDRAFMAFTEASSPGPSRAWRGRFQGLERKLHGLPSGALCYIIWHLP